MAFDFSSLNTGKIINGDKIITEGSKQNFYDQILSGHKELVNSNKFFEVANDLVTANMFPQFPWLLEPQKLWNLIIHISEDRPYRIIFKEKAEGINEEIKSIDNEFDKLVDAEKKKELSKRKTELTKKLKRFLLLGEYKRDEEKKELGKVIIYINNIADYCGYNLYENSYQATEKAFNNVLYSTYIHEMMHAYFDKPWEGNPWEGYIKEIEEPLAEFGMLDFIKNNGYADIDAVKELVKEKQECPEICYYGYGYYLFEQNKNDSLKYLYWNYKTGMGDAKKAKEFFKNGYPKKIRSCF